MNTITIPQSITKQGELVVVPRKEYEELLRFRSREEEGTLDLDIAEGIRDIKAGRVFGPFGNITDFKVAVKKYETSLRSKGIRGVSRAAVKTPRKRR